MPLLLAQSANAYLCIATHTALITFPLPQELFNILKIWNGAMHIIRVLLKAGPRPTARDVPADRRTVRPTTTRRPRCPEARRPGDPVLISRCFVQRLIHAHDLHRVLTCNTTVSFNQPRSLGPLSTSRGRERTLGMRLSLNSLTRLCSNGANIWSRTT